MKTSEEIRARIETQMVSMLLRPKMWAHTAISLETEYVNLLSIVLFIDEVPIDRIIVEWCKFANEEVGFSGPQPVAAWLKNNDKLDDDWKSLTMLLSKFDKFMSPSSNG